MSVDSQHLSTLHPAHRRRGRMAARGFTLLEMLVATSVGAIVLLVINATFFSALRLHNTTHERIDRDLELQRALAIMRRDFAGIMIPSSNGLAGQLQSDTFSSSTTDIAGGERVTPDLYTSSGRVDGWTPFGDVQMVSYYLTPDSNGANTKNLVRVVTRNLLPVQDETPEQQVLVTGVVSAEISFYDGTESSWMDTWDSSTTSTLPTAIKFSLTIAPLDTTSVTVRTTAPVELVVPVMATTTTSAQSTTTSS